MKSLLYFLVIDIVSFLGYGNMNHEITQLFSVPIYHADTGINNFDNELNFLETLDLIPSKKNSVSKNQNIFDHSEMIQCKNIVEEHVQNFVHNVFKCTQQLYVTNSWTAKSLKNQSHHNHHHPNSIISGVLYLQSKPNSGAITFHNQSPLKKSFNFTYNFTESNIFNANMWSYTPLTGEILLFPSWLNHEVGTNNSDDSRVIVGFNTFVKGTFNSTYAAELTL